MALFETDASSKPKGCASEEDNLSLLLNWENFTLSLCHSACPLACLSVGPSVFHRFSCPWQDAAKMTFPAPKIVKTSNHPSFDLIQPRLYTTHVLQGNLCLPKIHDAHSRRTLSVLESKLWNNILLTIRQQK